MTPNSLEPRPSASAGEARLPLLALSILAITAAFWLHPGLNMYPVGDGWQIYGAYDGDFSPGNLLFGFHRDLRMLPYLIARAWEPGGFRLLNLQLILIDAGILLGLFCVSRRVLGGRGVAAFLVACLAMFFPRDPTMFWLGAFGVNLSLLLMLWSSHAAFRALDQRRIGWLLLSLALLYLGARTYPGFLFLPLLLVSYVLVHDAGVRGYMRAFPKWILPQWVVLALAFAPTLAAAAYGGGYEARRADLDPLLIARGYGAMLANVGWRWTDSLAPPERWTWLPLAVMAVAAAIVLWRLSRRASTSSGAGLRPDAKSLGLFTCMCLGLMLASFLPYAVTDLRFEFNRELIGSRYAFLLWVAGLASWTIGRLREDRVRRIASAVAASCACLLLIVFCVNKLGLFEQRREQTVLQQIFLSDLARLVPCPEPTTPIVLLPQRGAFSRPAGNSMLLNRPQFPVQAMYGLRHMKVVSATPRQLRDGAVRLAPTGEPVIRKMVLRAPPLLVRYDQRAGMQLLPSLALPAGAGQPARMLQGANPGPATCKPTPMMRDLQRRRSANLLSAGLSR